MIVNKRSDGDGDTVNKNREETRIKRTKKGIER